jgi:hypothetical protein
MSVYFSLRKIIMRQCYRKVALGRVPRIVCEGMYDVLYCRRRILWLISLTAF